MEQIKEYDTGSWNDEKGKKIMKNVTKIRVKEEDGKATAMGKTWKLMGELTVMREDAGKKIMKKMGVM